MKYCLWFYDSFIDRRLTGILIYSTPVSGPSHEGQSSPLPPLEARYKVQGYLDDCKPAITCMSEFALIDKACDLFEKSSGCRLHRNPASGKCKVLALGRWQQTLQQEDIPLPYLKLTDHLDYLGCKLFANYTRTRKENGSEIKKKIHVIMFGLFWQKRLTSFAKRGEPLLAKEVNLF